MTERYTIKASSDEDGYKSQRDHSSSNDLLRVVRNVSAMREDGDGTHEFAIFDNVAGRLVTRGDVKRAGITAETL